MAASTYVFEVMNKEQDNISNKIVRKKTKTNILKEGTFSKEVLILLVVKVVLVVEDLVETAFQSIMWLMGSSEASLTTSIVYSVVHSIVDLKSIHCDGHILNHTLNHHLTLLATYVILTEVRWFIVIVEVTCVHTTGVK